MSISATKAGITACSVNGNDCLVYAHCIRVYESMCKPYITAEIVLINTDNAINTLKLKGGEPVRFTFIDGHGKSYSQTQYITAIPEEITSEGIRQEMVTLTTATIAYFKDRASLVQASFKNIPATVAAAQVHSQYIGTPLNVGMVSLGMIAIDPIGSYIVSNDKPFKAIKDIIARATYGGIQTGSTVYFENRFSHVIAPLEYIFNTMGQGARWVQKDTWGTSWQHALGFGGVEDAIIAAKLYKRADEDSKNPVANRIAGASLAKMVFSQFNRIPNINMGASGGGSFGGKNGGMQITQFMDEARNVMSVDPSMKTVAEIAYQAKVKDQTNYLVKVPIQAGLKLTVGRGVYLDLVAPEELGGGRDSGPYLVADLMHEVYSDSRLTNGTSVGRCVRKP